MQGTGVCVARAPIGARLPPLPAENLEISPPRSLNCAADCIRYDPGRDTCAPGARPHPPRRSHHRPQSTSGCVQNPVWACPGRRFVPVPRMSDIYIFQQGLSRHKQPDELNAIAISCGELVALSVLCVQRPGERRGSQSCLGIFVPPSLPGVRFVPRFGLGELRRFTKSEANITQYLPPTCHLYYSSGRL